MMIFVLAGGRVSAVQAAPTIDVSEPSVWRTNSGPVSYKVSYSNASVVLLQPAFITVKTTGTAKAAQVTVTGQAFERTVTLSQISGDGTLGVVIAGNSAIGFDGFPAPAAQTESAVTVDNTPPTPTIAPAERAIRGGLARFRVNYGASDTVTLKADDVTVHTTGTVTSTGVTVENGGPFSHVLVSGVTGAGTLSISLKAGTASDGLNSALAAGPSPPLAIDPGPPVATIGAPSVAGTRGGAVSFPVTYTGHETTNLQAGAVTVNKTGTVTHSNVTVTGSGSSYTVTVNGVNSGSQSEGGTVGISIAAGSAWDGAGFADAAGPSQTCLVDSAPPVLQIFADQGFSRGGTVSFTVMYRGHTSISLKKEDVTVGTTGSVSYTGFSVPANGSDTFRSVRVEGVTGEGTINISLQAGTAADALGQAPDAGPASVTIDSTPPLFTISAPQPHVTRTGSAGFAVTYTGHTAIFLDASYIIVNKTGTADFGSVTVTGSGDTRYVSLNDISGSGTLGITIAERSSRDNFDFAGASGPSQSVLVDNTPPNVTVNLPANYGR